LPKDERKKVQVISGFPRSLSLSKGSFGKEKVVVNVLTIIDLSSHSRSGALKMNDEQRLETRCGRRLPGLISPIASPLKQNGNNIQIPISYRS
jgi:hypothetical protein